MGSEGFRVFDAEDVGRMLEVGEGGIVDVEFPPYEERTGVMIRRREPGEASR